MKKIIIIFIALICGFSVAISQKIEVHQNGSILYQNYLSNINQIGFQQGNAVFSLLNNGVETIPISAIDSITFEPPAPNSPVIITYNGNSVDIQNPYQGYVNITANQATVTVNSTIETEIIVRGSTTNGSLSIASTSNIQILLDNVSITSSSLPPLQITSAVAAEIRFNSTNFLTDATGNSKNAALISAGDLIFNGYGTLQVAGLKKHAISSSKSIGVEKGNIVISAAATDGFHSEGFTMYNGNLNISACAGDGIDAGGGWLTVNNGLINITSTAADVKGIKSDGVLTINGGTITMTVSGAQSKAISSKSNININGGNINLTTSGAVVLETSGSGYDPSYCTAIKSDSTITINDGTIVIASTNTANGGKGISADLDVIINGGNITITTAGNGAVYDNSTGTKDSYTACCIKSNRNIKLNAGVINCQSSGTGGKAISADGTLTIGITGAANNLLQITAGTSGARFLVSGSTGGGGGPGGGGPGGGGGQSTANYANPKCIKSTGNMTINSGIIRINCTQTADGGEGLESKGALTINGGDIEVRSYDDPINGGTAVTINGGNVFAAARGNDAIDSNGTLAINGGLVIANGIKGDGEGLDSDNFYTLSGGVVLATSGSIMCVPAGPQKAIKYSAAKAGQPICVKNSANEVIVMYNVPIIQGASSGQTLILIFTDPRLVQGTYTLQYGGTISGGTNYNGYVTGGTYSGGSTKNFTIGTAAYTTVN
jgi:hypothetical protein